MTPRGGAIFDSRGTVGRIYKEDHYTLLHTKYKSSGPCGFGEEDFSHDAPGAGPVWTPGAWLAGFIEDHYTYKSSGPCGFREEDFLCSSHCMSMGANDPQGRAISDPRGMVGRIYKENHYKLLHTKYESSWPCGFGEDFFMFFP